MRTSKETCQVIRQTILEIKRTSRKPSMGTVKSICSKNDIPVKHILKVGDFKTR